MCLIYELLENCFENSEQIIKICLMEFYLKKNIISLYFFEFMWLVLRQELIIECMVVAS